MLPTKVTSLHDLRVKVCGYTHCKQDSNFLPPRGGLLLLLRSHRSRKLLGEQTQKQRSTWGSNHIAGKKRKKEIKHPVLSFVVCSPAIGFTSKYKQCFYFLSICAFLFKLTRTDLKDDYLKLHLVQFDCIVITPAAAALSSFWKDDRAQSGDGSNGVMSEICYVLTSPPPSPASETPCVGPPAGTLL